VISLTLMGEPAEPRRARPAEPGALQSPGCEFTSRSPRTAAGHSNRNRRHGATGLANVLSDRHEGGKCIMPPLAVNQRRSFAPLRLCVRPKSRIRSSAHSANRAGSKTQRNSLHTATTMHPPSPRAQPICGGVASYPAYFGYTRSSRGRLSSVPICANLWILAPRNEHANPR
jgi:hypothetical protein